MAQVSYSSSKRFRYHEDEFENEPVNREQTLRDILLKEIISNQLKTDLNVEECLENRKKFFKGENQKDVSEFTKGLLGNDSYKKICDDFDLKEILSSCDLDECDVEILLNENCKRGKESEEAYLHKLRNIKQKIELRRIRLDTDCDLNFSGGVQLTRHEYEEDYTKVSSHEAEKVSPCLVQLKPFSDANLHPDHPMNGLVDLEKRLFPRVLSEEHKQNEYGVGNKRKPEGDLECSPVKYFNKKPKSFWDMKERPIVIQSIPKENIQVQGCDTKPKKEPLIITKKTQILTPDYSKPFVWTLNTSKLIPLTTINNNKMTIQHLQSDPKFKNYHAGIPSSTLYIKNLPNKLSPLSIVSLFGHFEEENGSKIEYRILKGKMKGQAFVKFSSADIAVKSFNLCNGFIIEGKPMVVEYSKKCKD